MKMKRCLPTLLWAAALLAAACRPGETPEAGEPRDVLREITVSALPQTRSVLPGDDDFESRIREVTFAVYEMGGGLVTSAHTDSTSAVLRLLAGKTYAVYALVNMGDQRARLPAAESDMSVFRYDSGPFTNFGTRGMPMAGSGYMTVGADNTPFCIGLRRLMAKISFTVDHSALTQGVENCGIRHGSVHIRQAARALYPFMSGGSMAQNPNDIQSGEADLETIAPEHAFDLISAPMTFYVPENVQGDLLPQGVSPWEKVPDEVGLDVARRCTYLEFLAVKDGTADGVSGDIAFRFYLGADNRRNFDVRGNQHYVVRLELTWDNLFLDGSWKVTRGDDWADSRTLSITQNGVAAPEVVLLQPGGSAERLDLRFERGAGNRVLGARDSGYPPGWSLYADNRLLTGTSGTLGSGVNWRYVCSASEEYLELSAPSTHRGGDPHTFQLRSPDGQIQSLSVRSQVKPPLAIETGGTLMYLGQRGILRAANAPEGATLTWSASGNGGRFTPRSDGTALLEIVGTGSIQVTLSCAQTGQTARAYYTGTAIYMKTDETTLYAEPDGAPLAYPFSFYSTNSASNNNKLTLQSDYRETAYGREISRILYDELIFPSITVTIQDKTFLDLVDGNICVVHVAGRSRAFPKNSDDVLSTVTLTKNLQSLKFLSGTSPLTIKAANPFRYNYPLRTPADEEDFGLVSPWMHASYSADKDIHHSTIIADPDYCGIVARVGGVDVEPALQALFSWDGYQHTSYNLSNTTALSEHRGGLLTLHRCVINRHSLERHLSDPYAQFHLYVAGAVGGCLEDLGGGQALVKGVFAGGDYSATAFAGLSDTAFIGTERASGSSVSWSGGSAGVSGTGGLKKPGEGVYTLSGNASVNWAAAQQGFLPGLTLCPVTNVLEEGNGCLTYQTYYKLYPLNQWIQ